MLIIITQGGAKTELPRINSGAGTKWTGAPKVNLIVVGTKIISTMRLFVVRDRYFPHTHLDHNHPTGSSWSKECPVYSVRRQWGPGMASQTQKR